MTSLARRYGPSGSSDAPAANGAIATVVDEDDVGRRARREVGAEALAVVALARRCGRARRRSPGAPPRRRRPAVSYAACSAGSPEVRKRTTPDGTRRMLAPRGRELAAATELGAAMATTIADASVQCRRDAVIRVFLQAPRPPTIGRPLWVQTTVHRRGPHVSLRASSLESHIFGQKSDFVMACTVGARRLGSGLAPAPSQCPERAD